MCGDGILPSLIAKPIRTNRRRWVLLPRLGKNPDRDGKLANSATVFPAKAGTHFSAARIFQTEAMPYQLSSARAAERWTPAFAGATRKRAVMGILAQPLPLNPSYEAQQPVRRTPFVASRAGKLLIISTYQLQAGPYQTGKRTPQYTRVKNNREILDPISIQRVR